MFIGPSCPDLSERRHDAFDIRPPAVRGDVTAACREGRTTVVLIDGEMVYGYAPSPSELLDALRGGTRVFGASSLGALRAVELSAFGMWGHGWVFNAFRSGRIVGDDELVTLLFPENHKPLTVPLVRIRYALECLIGRGLTGELEAKAALCDLKALFYEDRTTERVDSALARAGIPPDVRAHIASAEFDIKRIDALSCIQLATLGAVP